MGTISRLRAGLGGALAMVALAACTAGSPEQPPEAPAPPSTQSPAAPSSTAAASGTTIGQPETITTGLEVPWSIAFHEATALISERDTARILELLPDASTREVATIDGVRAGGEGGLLGLAVRDAHLYVYSTAADGNRIQRFEILGEPGDLDLGPGETILGGLPSAQNHNGGRLAFGPDGMLYATVGDAGNADSAQNLEVLSGKILRMTPDGGVPDDNPFPASLVYSYGHRNPQGIAWDTEGTMYSSEFGQNTWDELNLIEPGGNYGWPVVEGAVGDDRFLAPVQQWNPADASPSGIAIAEGSIFIANLRGTLLREVPLADLDSSEEYFVGEYGRLRDVVVAPDGSLWVLTNTTDGWGDPGPEDDRILRVPIG